MANPTFTIAPAPAWTIGPLGPGSDPAWDALVGSAPESGFMQSSAWAAFKRLEGYETLRFGLFREGVLEGGASLLYYPGAEGFYLCPEGPVLPWEDVPRSREGLRKILAAVQARAEERGGLGLRVEPHVAPPRPRILRGWTRAPLDLTPVHTLLLDLTLPEEGLFAQMHPKCRYNVRLAERHDVRVFSSAALGEVSRFYPLFEETARRQGFFGEPFGYFLNLGSVLFSSGNARLFFAEWQGETLAVSLVIFFGPRATYLYGGTSRRSRNVMAAYALHLAAIRAARERGCSEYDFFGYDPFGQAGHPYAGFSRFKRQWGGTRRDSIGAYDAIFYDHLVEKMVGRLQA